MNSSLFFLLLKPSLRIMKTEIMNASVIGIEIKIELQSKLQCARNVCASRMASSFEAWTRPKSLRRRSFSTSPSPQATHALTMATGKAWKVAVIQSQRCLGWHVGDQRSRSSALKLFISESPTCRARCSRPRWPQKRRLQSGQ